MSIASIRSEVASRLKSGNTIDAKEAAELVKLAKTPEEKSVLRDVVRHDAFDSEAAQKALATGVGVKGEAGSKLAGKTVGTADGKPVIATREISPPGGYDNKLQAIGAARASGLTNTAVIADGSKPPRWHAVELNGNSSTLSAKAGKGMSEVQGLTQPLSDAKFNELNSAAQAAKDTYRNNPTAQNRAAAEAAYVKLTAATFGVKENEINVVPGKPMNPNAINFNLEIEHGQAHFGNAKGDSEMLPSDRNEKNVRTPHGITIGTSTFRDATQASGVLHHEATHVEQHKLGDKALADWRGSKTKDSFDVWLSKQMMAKKLTPNQTANIREQAGISSTAGATQHTAAKAELDAHINELAVTFRQQPANGKEAAMTLEAISRRATGLSDENRKTLQAVYDSVDETHRAVMKKQLPSVKFD